MTQTETPPRLVQHVRIKAPAARVFKALTDPAELLVWFPDRAEVDLRVGGAWRFGFDGGHGDAQGTFLELVPDRKVVYSWVQPYPGEDGRMFNLTVAFRLEPDGDETDLYLEESGYGEGPAFATVFGMRTNGWGKMLAGLAAMVEAA